MPFCLPYNRSNADCKRNLSKKPYVVAEDTDLSEVALEMAEKKHDCTLIVNANGDIVGIFTSIDACSGNGQVIARDRKIPVEMSECHRRRRHAVARLDMPKVIPSTWAKADRTWQVFRVTGFPAPLRKSCPACAS